MWAWLLVLGCASVIFFLSSQSQLPGLLFFEDRGLSKVLHAVEFGLLSLLLYWAIGCSSSTIALQARCGLSVLISVMFGISDEIHQMFVPMRYGDPYDVLADAVGSVCVFIVLRTVYAFRGAGVLPK